MTDDFPSVDMKHVEREDKTETERIWAVAGERKRESAERERRNVENRESHFCSVGFLRSQF